MSLLVSDLKIFQDQTSPGLEDSMHQPSMVFFTITRILRNELMALIIVLAFDKH